MKKPPQKDIMRSAIVGAIRRLKNCGQNKTKGETQMDAKELDKVIAGRSIISVEEGTTPGWLVINLSNEFHNVGRLFLTVNVEPVTGPEEGFSQFSLHRSFKGGSHIYGISDPRTEIAAPQWLLQKGNEEEDDRVDYVRDVEEGVEYTAEELEELENIRKAIYGSSECGSDGREPDFCEHGDPACQTCIDEGKAIEKMNMATKVSLVQIHCTESEIASCKNSKGQWHEPDCDAVLLAHGIDCRMTKGGSNA
jgi:hypothetical protein